MSAQDNGGPAFPSHGAIGEVTRGGMTLMGEVTHDGMTLRDYLAAKAMSSEKWNFYNGHRETIDSLHASATRCYQIADAMLEARK